MIATFFPNTLPTDTAQLVQKIHQLQPEFLQSFYLSGGTGLSLQIGHRESEDLDFFSTKSFNSLQLEKEICPAFTFANISAFTSPEIPAIFAPFHITAIL